MALSFLFPAFFWVLTAIPVVILLHFLRRNKRRKEVSALFLWRNALEITRNRRRFAASWVLFAQVLFIIFIVLALVRPNLSADGSPPQIFIIDSSASMAARDSDGVRIDKAVREAEKLIRGNGRALVIRAGLDATVVQPMTSNTRTLQEALSKLRAFDRDADLGRAIKLANSIASDGEVHLFSDQSPPSGATAHYHDVSGDGVNIGIRTFEVGMQQAYVAVISTSPRPQEVVVEITKDGEAVSKTSLLIPAKGQSTAILPLASHRGIFEARIKVPSWDALSLDDTAYAAIEDQVVVIDSRSPQIIKALDAIPGVTWSVSRSPETFADADVRILTGVDPATLSGGRYVLFPTPSSNAQAYVVKDWDQVDSLLRFVDLREAVVGIDPVWSAGEGNWKVLAWTRDLKPVLIKADYADLRIVNFAFHPSQTNIVLRPAFPALITNILREFSGDKSLELGTPLPDGSTLNGVLVQMVEVPGSYVVEENLYTANLNSVVESRLESSFQSENLPTNYQNLEVSFKDTTHPVYIWFVLIALVVLVGEWILWARTGGRNWVMTNSKT